jgi:hypothetical protein
VDDPATRTAATSRPPPVALRHEGDRERPQFIQMDMQLSPQMADK